MEQYEYVEFFILAWGTCKEDAVARISDPNGIFTEWVKLSHVTVEWSVSQLKFGTG